MGPPVGATAIDESADGSRLSNNADEFKLLLSDRIEGGLANYLPTRLLVWRLISAKLSSRTWIVERRRLRVEVWTECANEVPEVGRWVRWLVWAEWC